MNDLDLEPKTYVTAWDQNGLFVASPFTTKKGKYGVMKRINEDGYLITKKKYGFKDLEAANKYIKTMAKKEDLETKTKNYYL